MSAGVVVAALLAGLAVWLAMADEGRLRALGPGSWWRRVAWRRWLPVLPRRADVQRSQRVLAELPETLELLAAALDAGLPPRQAARQVAAVAAPHAALGLRQVVARVEVGMAESDAWAALADDGQWHEAAQEMARAVETGTGASASLRRLAVDARARRRDVAVRRARAVGVKAVWPLMGCFLPAFLLVGVVPIVAGVIGSGLLR